jgi:hypothetical protein
MALSPKHLAIRSFLRNPTNARTFRDALDTPVGSSKRANAMSLLKSAEKIAARKYGGQGGPGDVQGTSFRGVLPVAGDIASSLWNAYSSGANAFSKELAKIPPALKDVMVKRLQGAEVVVGAAKGAKELAMRAAPQVLYNPSGAPFPSFSSTAGSQMMQAGLQGLQANNGVHPLTQMMTPSPPPAPQQTVKPPEGVVTLPPTGAFMPPPAGSVAYDANAPETPPAPDSAPPGPTDTSVTSPPAQQYGMAPDTLDDFFSKFTPADQARMKPVYDAVKAQTGEGAFESRAMSDPNTLNALLPSYKDKLKEIFPNVPEEQLPVGASLMGQEKMLVDSVTKKNNLDELQNKVSNYAIFAPTVAQDLQKYVEGKDSAIKDFDKMIEEARKWKADNATGLGPSDDASIHQYIDFLTAMKADRQKGYDQIIKDNVNSYNEQLNVRQAQYDTASQIAQKELTLLDSGLKAYDKEARDAIKGMYDQWENYDKTASDAFSSSLAQQASINSQIKTADSGLSNKNVDDFKFHINDANGMLKDQPLLKSVADAANAGLGAGGVYQAFEQQLQEELAPSHNTNTKLGEYQTKGADEQGPAKSKTSADFF